VLTLGELLTAELPDRALTAKTDQWFLQVIATNEDMIPSEEQRREVLRERSKKARQSVKRYEDVAHARVTWLVNRIVGIAPESTRLSRFRMVYWRFYMTSTLCTFDTIPGDGFDEEEYDRRWKQEEEGRAQLTDAVEELLGRPVPRNPSWLRRRWRALVGSSREPSGRERPTRWPTRRGTADG
jgi:hypothetical protein